MMLRVAKIPSLNIAPAVIDVVAEELRGGDKTKEGDGPGVLRIEGREYLFLPSEDFMDDISLHARTNWTGKCPS